MRLNTHCQHGPRSPKKGGQQGAVAIMLAILLPILIGLAALAVDVGHLAVVRNELQNAADAAAMAGAGYFKTGSPYPNWDLAHDKALAAVSLNQADFRKLSDGTVETGYWNVTDPAKGLQATSITPGAFDYPAVKVSVFKDEGKNGGKVTFYLAPIVGVNSGSVVGKAVAVISSPGNVGPSGLFPFVISKCMMDNYWNSSATPPGPTIDPVTQKPYVFSSNTVYNPSPGVACDVGQWTSFATDANDTTTMRGLIDDGNPVGLAMGDKTWVEPGSKTTLFDNVNNCSAAGDKSCEYVTFPVVQDVVTHAAAPILAFACIHILSAKGGSQKSILLEMSSNCQTPNSSGAGPAYGATTPPRLVQ